MRSLTILTLTLLVHFTCCQSGSEPDGRYEDTEAETPEYECFMKLCFLSCFNKLTCFLKDSEADFSNISFQVCCNRSNSCEMLKPKNNKYALLSSNLMPLNKCEICILQLQKKVQCKTYELKSIVKPHAPTNINITYQKEGKEYIITYNVKLGLLKQDLFHQTAIREEHGKWKYLQDVKILQFRLLEQNLKPNVTYEVKVRSKPDGNFFKGIWSDWSDPGYFETKIEDPEDLGDPAYVEGLQMVIIIIPSVVVLLLFVVIFMVLWKKRIKPYVWPHIPDHKSALDQLCKKQLKNLDISFSPDYFVDVHIHKVDRIQAKTQEDSLLDPSEILDEDLDGESPNQSPLKTTMASMFEKVLVPPTMLTKKQPAVLQDAPLPGHGESSSNVAQDYENPANQTQTVNGTSRSPAHFRVRNSDPDLQIPVVKSSCQEEAYVTMSAFPAASIPR